MPGIFKTQQKVTHGKTWTNTNRTNKHKDSGSLYMVDMQRKVKKVVKAVSKIIYNKSS